MICGANAAGRGPAAYGGGNIAAVHRPDIAAGVGAGSRLTRRGSPGRLFLLHLLDQGLNPGLDRFLFLRKVVQGVLLLLLLRPELGNQGIGCVPLGIQVPLLGLQFCLGFFRGVFLSFQLCLFFSSDGLEDL